MLKLSLILLVISISLARLETADIQAIFNKMTNEDKCGQMTQVTFQVIEKLPKPTDPEENPIDEAKLRTAIIEKRVGSILNTPYDYAVRSTVWQKMITLIEDVALKETDLKIPIIYGIDSIHGANYIQEAILFPQPLSLGASFNVDLAYGSGMYTAMETRAVGIPWNFNPVLDVGRQPLWPRFWETFGEDSYLASKLGEHYIKGSQGNSLKNRSCVATCLKHYIGYSYPANGLDRSEAYIPEKLLRDVFLPPFAAGVAAGSPTVMINSGNVNGIPGHMNGFYIDDILKGELKFEGFTVSDWEDVVRLHTRDKVAETPEDAVRISVMNGLDMSMVPYDFSFYDHCVNLSKKNPQFVERINDSTMRILKVKDQLGLFEDPYPVASDLNKVGSDAAWQFTLEAAQESIILAKNDDNILPLAPNTRILVTGPTGNFLRVLHGGWSYTWQGNDESTFENYGSRPKQTVYAAIKQTVDSAQFVQAVDFNNVIDINAAVAAAQNVDVIVLTIGEDTYTETPGNINDLAISQSQVELANAVLALGKPVLVIYIGGRPRIMTEIGKKANAAILAFLPGNRGGEAIADVLFGRINPSGRLPFTYPAYPNGHNHYDLLPIEQFDLNKYEYLFPFGHGLSYTTFQYSNLQLSTSNLVAPNSLTVSVTVTNTGNRAGKESVLLYLHDVYGSVPRPLKQLKRFTKVNLEPAASQTLTFTLTMDDLSFTDINYKRIYEAGDFNVYIGDLKGSFKLTVNTAATTTARTVPTTKPNSSTRVMITNYFNIFMIILLASSVFFF